MLNLDDDVRQCECGKPCVKGRVITGVQKYQKYCGTCRRTKWKNCGGYSYNNSLTKGPICGRCGFIAEDPCQLDVDHVQPIAEGGADDMTNIQTLCANCHRLKSYQERQKYGWCSK